MVGASVVAERDRPIRKADAPENNRLPKAEQAFTLRLTSILAVAQTGVPFERFPKVQQLMQSGVDKVYSPCAFVSHSSLVRILKRCEWQKRVFHESDW